MHIGAFDTKEKVLVVAEVGNNHEGNFEVAKELVRKAAESGADAVKFQTFITEHYVSKLDTARFNRLKSFEFSFAQFSQLADLTRSLGLLFISTPFDLKSAEFLRTAADAIKVASGDNNFYPLIASVAQSGKPVIISSGLSDLEHVRRIVKFVEEQWSKNGAPAGELAILHCVSSYPVPPAEANLQSIPLLAKNFSHTIGYSDHTIGIEAATLAVALGARIIEKHFTLDKHFSDFRDHQLSADPGEMKELVEGIRTVSALLGVADKKIQPSEEAVVAAVRRSIVAGRDLANGHCIVLADLTWIRPAGGLNPGEEGALIGKTLNRDVAFGERLQPSDVE